MRNGFRALFALSMALTSIEVSAKTLCVGTSTTFADALLTSSANDEDDLIKLMEGTYIPPTADGFFVAITDSHALTISGGFHAGANGAACGAGSTNAYLTILDGSSNKKNY